MKRITAFLFAVFIAIISCGCAPKVFRANLYSPTEEEYKKIVSAFQNDDSPFSLTKGSYRLSGNLFLKNGINSVYYASDISFDDSFVKGKSGVVRKTPILNYKETLNYYLKDGKTYLEKNGEAKPFTISIDDALSSIGCPSEFINLLSAIIKNIDLLPVSEVETARYFQLLYVRIKINAVSVKPLFFRGIDAETAVGDVYLTYDEHLSHFIGFKLTFKSCIDEDYLRNNDVIVGNVGMFTQIESDLSFYKK